MKKGIILAGFMILSFTLLGNLQIARAQCVDSMIVGNGEGSPGDIGFSKERGW